MTFTRRNLVWPVFLALVGGLWLLVTVGLVPDAIGDILLRAWPLLLILFGLDLLVGRRSFYVARQPIPASVPVLVAALALLAVVAWLGYTRQADVVYADKTIPFTQAIAPDVSQVRVEAAMERADITVAPGEGDARTIEATYQGGEHSDVAFEWNEGGEVPALTITERELPAIPRLTEFGRGTLALALPPDVAVQELMLGGDAGDITAHLRPVRIGQLHLAVGEGDLTVDLPADAVMTGTLRTGDGNITLNVPRDVALTLSVAPGRGQPTYEYDQTRYDLLANGTLKIKNTDAFDIGLTVSLPQGARLTVNDVE